MSQFALIDAGPLIAFYNKRDKYHHQVCDFFEQSTLQLVTTDACIAETMYHIGQAYGESHKVQALLSLDIADGIWQREALTEQDFLRIAELFEKYSDVPADFADLSLVVISERLDIPQVVSLDSDFDIYRRFNSSSHTFERVFYPRKL